MSIYHTSKLMIKSSIVKLLHFFGYEIKNISGIPEDRPPAWMLTEPQPTDSQVPGEWVSSVLDQVTHAHRPDKLVYHRHDFGEDHRIKYVASFLDLRDLRVLELGPCEGYWSILLEKMGVRETVSIELRPENLTKCERIKLLYQLDHTTFLEHNIEELAEGNEQPKFTGPFDLVFCLGLLYHLPAPAQALKWCRTQSPRLFLGTHYHEPAEPRRYIPGVFNASEYKHNDRTYTGMNFREGGMADPISGASAFSFWPREDDLIAMLHDAGYNRVEVLGRDILNRMPHITLIAEV